MIYPQSFGNFWLWHEGDLLEGHIQCNGLGCVRISLSLEVQAGLSLLRFEKSIGECEFVL